MRDIQYECEDCQRDLCSRCYPFHNEQHRLRLALVFSDSSEDGQQSDGSTDSNQRFGRGHRSEAGKSSELEDEDEESVFDYDAPVRVGYRLHI